MSIELSIVMPCLNEAETLETCIRKARTFLARSGVPGEIVIGDNGSTDGSQEIARRNGARVVDVPMRGYGAALYYAIMESRGRYCIMGDSDDSYDFLNLDAFVKALRAGADLVMGNRFRGGIAPGAMPWKNRYIGNPVLSWIGRVLFDCPARDFHCGLRGFSRDAFLRMDLRTTGMEFASEMVIKATLMGMRVVEVPTTLSPDGRSRPPHLRPYRDGWRHLRFMLVFSPDWLFLYPGLLLIALGLVLGGALFMTSIRLGGVRLGIDTLVYCATMIEIGFQAVLFMLLSRTFAVQEGLYPRERAGRLFAGAYPLERGLALGGGLIAVGLAAAIYAVRIWLRAHLGDLDVETVTRIVIVSALFIALGFETVLTSFFLGTLELNVRKLTVAEAVPPG